MISVEAKIYYLEGEYEGIKKNSELKFGDWEDACAWAGTETMDFNRPFVVLTLVNKETGEIKNF
jgi:hypothetical protein